MTGALGAAHPQSSPPRVAFHYEAVFPPAALAWYTRFDVLVLGAFLDAAQTAALRKGRARLVAYEWSTAFYPGDPVSAHPEWQQRVRANAASWLLSGKASGGGAAHPGREALWYDFASAELRKARAAHLASRLESTGYDGLFFDTLGFEQLPPPMRDLFQRRHPGLDYNRCQGLFLAELRRLAGPGRILFTNQGYRQAEHFLPHADFDLSESAFTLNENGATRFRPWHDPAAPWESIRLPVEQLIAAALRRFPKVRFVHLNYAAGDARTIRRAIRYSLACARLWNHQSYLVAPGGVAVEQDQAYFEDPGRPAAGNWREDAGLGVAWREYEHGVAAINSAKAEAVVPGTSLRMPEAPAGYFFATPPRKP